MAGYLDKYYLGTGISNNFASTNTPQQNGTSGGEGRTIASITRCLSKCVGFSKSLWGEMLFAATYLIDRMPHSALQTHASSNVLHGLPAKLGHLRKISARTFVRVETPTAKLDDKA